MNVSRLAVALAARFGIDIAEALSRAAPDERCINIIEELTGYLSRDKILACYLYQHEGEDWALDVMATGCYYRETSLTEASIIFKDWSLPATVMLACSNRSIPITRIVEPSATFDPFFLRNDVVVQSVTQLYSIDLKAMRRVPSVMMTVTF